MAITPAAGETLRFDRDVSVAEIAEVTRTSELSPYDNEYTGYMGNWGNTMDRWYRRAAIVIWPRSRAFAARAKGERTLSSWLDPRHAPAARPFTARAAWVASLPDLCANLQDDRHRPADLGTEEARALTARVGDWLIDAVRQAARIATPSRRQTTVATLANPTLAVLRAARIVDDTTLRDRIVAAVRKPAPPLVPILVDVFQTASTLPPVERTTMGLGIIAQHCRDALDASLTQPPRASDDWSITEFQAGTCCEDCTTLAAFLADPATQQTTWPLAKPRRQHIHHRLDEAELPVTHHTTRQGSPHKLVITKTPDLHLRDTDRRRAHKESLTTVQQFLDATE